MFANARTSLLFNEQSLNVVDNDGDILAINNDAAFAFNGEAQIGAEWQYQSIFLRAAFEGQYWANVGTANPPALGYDGTDPMDDNLGFLGFTLGGGVSY